MHVLFTAILSDEVLQAVCWTLIHSLWQGLVAAVIAALIITLTKRSSANLRYNLLIAVVALFIVTVSITAKRELSHPKGSQDVSINANSKVNAAAALNLNPSAGLDTGSSGQENFEGFNAWCNQYASTIVSVWLLIFLIKCGQLIMGFHYLRRLRYRNNYEVDSYWKERLLQLTEKTGIRRSIAFLESELVKVPAVIGFLKPVLLVPAGLLSHLPPEQVEAILIHELAHIHRKDFLVNVLQSFVETFFFFNPAILWISSLIREEREACCDDMVIANIPLKNSYLEALVSFHELQFNSNQRAMALTGNQHYLFNRVKRMLTLENKKLNLMEKTLLLVSVTAITAFGFITKEIKESPAPLAPKKEIVQPFTKELSSTTRLTLVQKPVVKQKKLSALSLSKHNIDTVPKVNTKQNAEMSFRSISSNTSNDGNRTISQLDATDNDGKNYRIKRVDNKITELSVNGTIIPQSQYGDYDEVIRQIDESQRLRVAKQKQDIAVRRAIVQQEREKRKQLSIAKQKELSQKIELRKETQIQNKLKRGQERKLLEQKNELQKAAYRQKKAALMQNEILYNQKKIEMMQHKNLYNKKMAEVTRKQNLLKQSLKNDDIKTIIADLNNQDLVTDSDDLTFSLDDKELVVNGKKQPSEIHRQFKEKYIHNNNDRFIYSKKGNQTSITINKE